MLCAPFASANFNNAIKVLEVGEEDFVPELHAEKKVAPRYPPQEQKKGRMGFTLFELTVSPEGYPRDVTLERSSSKYFTKASVKAVHHHRYAPPADGQPRYGVLSRFTYAVGSTRNGVSRIDTKELQKSVSATLKSA